jgi:hypothetical protein
MHSADVPTLNASFMLCIAAITYRLSVRLTGNNRFQEETTAAQLNAMGRSAGGTPSIAIGESPRDSPAITAADASLLILLPGAKPAAQFARLATSEDTLPKLLAHGTKPDSFLA